MVGFYVLVQQVQKMIKHGSSMFIVQSVFFMSVKVAMGSELIKADWSGENRDLRLTDHDFRWANCRFGQQILAF